MYKHSHVEEANPAVAWRKRTSGRLTSTEGLSRMASRTSTSFICAARWRALTMRQRKRKGRTKARMGNEDH